MVVHEVRVHPSSAQLPRHAQLTWKLAEVAAAAPPPAPEVAEMVACRVIDNAGVALAAIVVTEPSRPSNFSMRMVSHSTSFTKASNLNGHGASISSPSLSVRMNGTHCQMVCVNGLDCWIELFATVMARGN